MIVLIPSTVIPGLVPGIHVFAAAEAVDGRNECGHDVCGPFKVGRVR